jgi:hypothetical protein
MKNSWEWWQAPVIPTTAERQNIRIMVHPSWVKSEILSPK